MKYYYDTIRIDLDELINYNDKTKQLYKEHKDKIDKSKDVDTIKYTIDQLDAINCLYSLNDDIIDYRSFIWLLIHALLWDYDINSDKTLKRIKKMDKKVFGCDYVYDGDTIKGIDSIKEYVSYLPFDDLMYSLLDFYIDII